MNRTQWIALAAVGMLTFAVAFVITAPATVVPGLLGEVSGVRLADARGSLWRGTARVDTPAGTIGDIRWTLQGTALLSGRVRLGFSLDGTEVSLAGEIRHSPMSGRTELADVNGRITMTLLSRLSGIEQLVLADIAAENVMLSLDDGRLAGIDGIARLRDVTLIAPQRTLLGQYVLQLGQADGWLQATVAESSGPMNASGVFALTADGAWRMDLRLQADDPDGDIARGLAFVGPADELGRRHLVYSGEL